MPEIPEITQKRIPMDEQTKQKLIEYVQEFGEFAKSEAPLVASEYINWTIINNSVIVFVCLIFGVLDFNLG